MRAFRFLALAMPTLAANSASATPIASKMLIGTWELVGARCEGDNSVTDKADGTFGAYDVSGRWVLRGTKLVTTITERGEPDEGTHPVKPPEKHESIIISLTRDRLTERWVDGSLHHLHRCH